MQKNEAEKKLGGNFASFLKQKNPKLLKTLNSIKNEKIFRLPGNFDNGGNTYIRFLSCI